jgi:hypothetical protein
MTITEMTGMRKWCRGDYLDVGSRKKEREREREYSKRMMEKVMQ